jgi:hypothetical protein
MIMHTLVHIDASFLVRFVLSFQEETARLSERAVLANRGFGQFGDCRRAC